jgi:hypothetical protein
LLEDIRQAEVRTKALQQGSDSEVAEHTRCMAINDAWNLSIVPLREARLAEQNKARAERALIGLSIHERVKQEKAAVIESAVLAEKVCFLPFFFFHYFLCFVFTIRHKYPFL